MVEAVTQIQEEFYQKDWYLFLTLSPFFFLYLFLLHDLIHFIDAGMGPKESKLVTTEEARGHLSAV